MMNAALGTGITNVTGGQFIYFLYDVIALHENSEAHASIPDIAADHPNLATIIPQPWHKG